MSSPLPHVQKDAAQDSFGRRLLEWLLILFVFFIVAGDPVPGVNEPHYLGRLKHYWCPPWGAGDLFLDSPDAHLVFVWGFGWLTKWLSLPATAWVGRVLAWSLLAWAWQRLSWRVVPVPFASVLSAAAWVTFMRQGHLAGEWVVGGVEAKCFAYVFVLLALRWLVDRKWNRVWLLLGAASAFHALVGGWSVVVCGGIWIAERFRRSDDRNSWTESLSSMLPGLIGGGLLALLGVVPALALTWNEPPELVAEANQIYVFERLPHHLAPLTQPLATVVERFTRHALLLLVLVVLVRLNRVVASSNGDDVDRSGDSLDLITTYACGAVLLAIVGLLIELAFRNDPERAASLLRFYWFRLTDFAIPTAAALQLVHLLAVGLARRRNWAAWGLAATLAYLVWQMTPILWQRAVNPVPTADRRMRAPVAWAEMCDWVAENTPPDALFLTPRWSHTFTWRTDRPQVAVWKDIPQDARSMVEWFDRVRKLHYIQVEDVWLPLRSAGELGTARVKALAQEFGAGYVVSDQRFPLALPIVYPNAEHQNDEYAVYRVEP